MEICRIYYALKNKPKGCWNILSKQKLAKNSLQVISVNISVPTWLQTPNELHFWHRWKVQQLPLQWPNNIKYKTNHEADHIKLNYLLGVSNAHVNPSYVLQSAGVWELDPPKFNHASAALRRSNFTIKQGFTNKLDISKLIPSEIGDHYFILACEFVRQCKDDAQFTGLILMQLLGFRRAPAFQWDTLICEPNQALTREC